MADKKETTREALEKLKEELENRKVNIRKEIAESIKEAREQGDLSENAEYDAARDAQRENESRIEELENMIKNSVVSDNTDSNRISVGSAVKLLDMEYDEEIEFFVVGSNEVNSLENKISNESPIGRAMNGRYAGETFEVDFNGNISKYKILEVTRY